MRINFFIQRGPEADEEEDERISRFRPASGRLPARDVDRNKQTEEPILAE